MGAEDIYFYNTNGKLIRRFLNVDSDNLFRLQRECRPCGCSYKLIKENGEPLEVEDDVDTPIKYSMVIGTERECRDLMFWCGLTKTNTSHNFEIDNESKDEIIYLDAIRFKEQYNHIKKDFKKALKGKYIFAGDYAKFPDSYAYWCITYKEDGETFDFIIDDYTRNSGLTIKDFPKLGQVVEMSFWGGVEGSGQVFRRSDTNNFSMNKRKLTFWF